MHRPADAADPNSAAHAFLVASRALVAVAARSLAGEDDITIPQFRALVTLSRSPTMAAGDLASALAIHPSTATRLCDRLVAKKLTRRATDPEDRRRVVLVLTSAGRQLVERVTQRRLDEISAITARMTPQDRAGAVRALRAFADAAGEDQQHGYGWSDQPDL